MSMNTRDPRLYHYEYRRPRLYNPTYNSNHLFDSLNMFVGNDQPSLSLSGRYNSMPRREAFSLNQSELLSSHTRGLQNYSTISNEGKGRQGSYLTDKDHQYLRMLDQKARGGVSSRGAQNPEGACSPLKYNMEDSLSRKMQQFQTIRR